MIDYSQLREALNEINDIVCNAFKAKYFGDLQISEIQALLNDIIDITGCPREENEE